MHHASSHRSAFTLIEMSIVLVIIGLIIGAVAIGTSLLKQSEIKTIIADYSKYMNAANQFNQQYGGWPGDLADATNYFGKDTTNCNTGTDSAGNPGTCNGDGDGRIGMTNLTAVNLNESAEAWRQLQYANLITGNYTRTVPIAIGSSAAPSRISAAGWSFFNNSNYVNTTDLYKQDIGNMLAFGSLVASNGSAYTITMGPAITPTNASQVDKKIDDGMPATGRVLAQKPSPSTVMPNCTTSATDASALYNMSNNTAACGLLMSLTTK